MKNFQLSFFLSIFAICLLSAACTDKNMETSFGTTILDTMSNEKLQSSTRASMEDFEEGKEEKVTFTVIYQGNLESLAQNNDSDFKALMDAYGLEMQQPFEIDEEHKGIVLVPSSKLMTPIQVGKEISMVNEVMMVEVSGINDKEGVS